MVKIYKEINGHTYEYEVGRNYLIGESIKGNKDGYKLTHRTDGFISTIFFQTNNFFNNKEKNIGLLCYDFDNDIVTYKKFIKQSTHEFHKSDSIGLNWEIVSNMCPKDFIIVIEDCGNKRLIRSISVSKALKFQDFKYFKYLGYEKQVFIPACEFKTKELEKKKKRVCGGNTNKTRKRSS